MRQYVPKAWGNVSSVIISLLVGTPTGLLVWSVLDIYEFSWSLGVKVGLSIGAGLLLAILMFLAWRLSLLGYLKAIDTHLGQLAENNFDYRSKSKQYGLAELIRRKLNQLSERLEEYSEQNQAELAIINTETSRLRNVINSINDGVVALDGDSRILLFNHAASQISGFSVAEAAGQPINHILPFIKGTSLVVNDWLLACQGGDLLHQKWEGLRLRTKEGKNRSIDVEAVYEGTDPNGIRALVTFHDRTEAQEIEDMKVDFVALAAHELRTPITVIRGYLEILENELKGQLSPDHREFMRKLNISAAQLSGFINNILHVSQIEHGDLNLKLEPTDWIDLIKHAVAELTPKAEVQGKKLVLSLPPQLPLVSVDRMSIIEVVNNLVDNAIKYSDEGREVVITLRSNGNMIETIVSDHGIGIPENAIDKLFTKFYRSHRTRGSHRGTGLGLYMSKAIIEAHGGSVWVRSKV